MIPEVELGNRGPIVAEGLGKLTENFGAEPCGIRRRPEFLLRLYDHGMRLGPGFPESLPMPARPPVTVGPASGGRRVAAG